MAIQDYGPAASVSRCWCINGGDSAVHLPRAVPLTLENAHQLAAGTDHLATLARLHGVVVGPPFEGMVAENPDLLNVEHRFEDFGTRHSAKRFCDDAAPAQYGARGRKQDEVIR